MKPILRLVFQLSWLLGLVSIIAAVAVKLLHAEQRWTVNAHTFFLIAGTLFLCALATRAMEKE